MHHTTQHGPLLRKLLLATIMMFGFGFALVPLYDVFCEITGINGKTRMLAASDEGVQVVADRLVTVQFLATPALEVPLQIEAEMQSIQVHPGEVRQLYFEAENQSAKGFTAQAVPSVSPGQAAVYFNKMECFCFRQQKLLPHQKLKMPLQFYLDPALPAGVNTITLSYTFYAVPEQPELTAQLSQIVGKEHE